MMMYHADIEKEIQFLSKEIESDHELAGCFPPRWLAIQLLEGDTHIVSDQKNPLPAKVQSALAESISRLQNIYSDDLEIVIADNRYQYVRALMGDILTRDEKKELTRSDRIDQIVTSQYLGIPIFLSIMYVIFNIVQNVSAPFLDWIDYLFSGPLTNWATALLTALNAPDWLLSLTIDGMLAGVGGVLVFFPGLYAMYFCLAILEQSGYLARAAFVMDRFMSKIGLHGKSFIPMILGFGCNVPAIYATRTIEKREARLLTALLIPFMSCAARLPVYIVFGLAFFPDNANLVILGLYITGIVIAAVVGLILSRTLFKGHTLSILVMELPAYGLPSLKCVLMAARDQSKEFLYKAGTLIVGFSLILWFLLNMPWGVTDPQQSLYGKVSAEIAPILEPAGFGKWEASGALVTGMVAKEIVVSTLAQVYHLPQEVETTEDSSFLGDVQNLLWGLGEATIQAGKELLDVFTPGISLFPNEEAEGENVALSRALQASFTPLSAISFLLFVLLYVPCVATIGAQKQEFGWRWAAVSVAITLIVPWMISVTVYQVGTLLGLG
ncbi:MAG: ferrous iron transport protein B [Anaerolineales bacterium]|jgi:ferrous iron transport protein B